MTTTKPSVTPSAGAQPVERHRRGEADGRERAEQEDAVQPEQRQVLEREFADDACERWRRRRCRPAAPPR